MLAESNDNTPLAMTLAAASAGAAVLSVIVSLIALYQAGNIRRETKDMFRRQSVIELHNAWEGVNEIDPNKLITPDVIKAVNAIRLTSTLWNHDVVDRAILHQEYSDPFSRLYVVLSASTKTPPGHSRTCRDMLSDAIAKTYDEMRARSLKKVEQTRIGHS